jgi:hypothetical protein
MVCNLVSVQLQNYCSKHRLHSTILQQLILCVSVSQGSNAGKFFKVPAKMGSIIKACFYRNVKQVMLRLKQLLAFFNSF